METLATIKVSIVLRPICNYGDKRKNTKKGPRDVSALRHPVRFNG